MENISSSEEYYTFSTHHNMGGLELSNMLVEVKFQLYGEYYPILGSHEEQLFFKTLLEDTCPSLSIYTEE